MNKPPLSLLALLLIAPLFAGGCTLYTNPSVCKARIREAVANATPSETLSISHVGVGIDGSRVVVEGTVRAAAAPAGASDTSASHPAKKPVAKPAAAECTFEGDKLKTLRWLAPPELANPPSAAATNG